MANTTGSDSMRLSLAKRTTRARARALASSSPGRMPRTTCMLGQMYMCTNIHMTSPPMTPPHSSSARAGGTFQVVVPTARLDSTVAALSRIGKPVRLERSATNVTDQAVSLDDQLGDLLTDAAQDLAPGASASSVALGVEASAALTATTTNTATWTATNQQGVPYTATASATVTVTAEPAVAAEAAPNFTG